MDYSDLLKATEARFHDRASIRSTIQAKLSAGLLLQADSADRVEKRLKRLGLAPAIAKRLAGSSFTTILPTIKINTDGTGAGDIDAGDIDPEVVNTLERIIHQSDLVSVNFFDRGTNAARAIGRIQIRTPAGSAAGFGTGFLVSPRLLLTNNHVLPTAQIAALSQIEFNFQAGLDGSLLPTATFGLKPNELFLTDKLLDYSLVAVEEFTHSGTPLASFGWHPLIAAEGKVIVGESVSIIQHPNGEAKQVALRENQIIDVLPDFLHYQTDTAPGSSGSPVFNDQWEVVALHHSGVPKRNDRGQILNRSGEPWTAAQGEHRVEWLANEGVRVSRITQHIKHHDIAPSAKPLIDQLLGGSMPAQNSPPQPDRVPERSSAEAVPAIVHPNGTATWTIPLQISIQIGSPVATPAATSAPPTASATPATTPSIAPQQTEADLNQALKELKAASKKNYYDETRDRQDRDTYYQTLTDQVATLSATQLYQALSRLVTQTHKTKSSYQPAKHLYPWVDLHPDLKIRSIYSEQTFEPEALIRADFQVEQLRAIRSQELMVRESFSEMQLAQALDLLEASLPYNCEHVVPQSWFAKKEPMRGDLHHLFACEVRCNSFRSNTPYYDFEDFGEAIQDNCGKSAGTKFEPKAGKGAVARATLYFLLRYPGEINKTDREYQADRLQTLLDWHATYPVTEYEQHRNAAIFERQGNRNPLIDFPDWAEKIAFRSGLS